MVLLRQDPPFDLAYITSTHMLERIHPKTLVVNDPAHVRNAPEKIFVTEFPDLMPPTLITRDLDAIKAFRAEHGDIVMKPLYGKGGEAVFLLAREDLNFGSLYDLFATMFREPWVVQKFLPAVKEGDKRIILVDGEFAGAVNRVPAPDDLRSNMVRGGVPAATDLTAREREICAPARPGAARARPDVRRHRRDRRLLDRDQRHLADRHPLGEESRRPRHRGADLGRDRGEALMSALSNRQVRLKTRPNGIPQAENFEIVDSAVPEIADGQFLVRNDYLSVEPAMRGWVSAVANYSKPVGIGEVMRAFTAGTVVKSRHAGYAPGDAVMGLLGWQDYAVSNGGNITRKIKETDLPLSLSLGVLGLNGVTAYFGLLDTGRPRPGDTVVVSTAAGAVGSAVGQIARVMGCRTVGLTGGAAKVKICEEDFGFDAAIDYKAGKLAEALAAACPRGIDVYFDNTAGAISDAVLAQLAVGARVVICGTAWIFELGSAAARAAGRAPPPGQARHHDRFSRLRLSAPLRGGDRAARRLGTAGQAALPRRHFRRHRALPRARSPSSIAATISVSGSSACSTDTMLISGKEKLERMRDGRVVYIGVERVDDVTTHPAFRNGARTIAAIYDLKADPAKRDLFTFEENGERIGLPWLRCRSREDLARRMRAMKAIADFSYGMIGRSPDHVAGLITGLATRPGIAQRAHPRLRRQFDPLLRARPHATISICRSR